MESSSRSRTSGSFVIAVVVALVLLAVVMVALFWRSAWWFERPPEDVGGYGSTGDSRAASAHA